MTYQLPLDNEIIVDNFAGGGGASTGIEMALRRPVNIAINHDRQAISMHEVNHPLTKHYCEDVWDVNPRKICAGRRVALAWFSPDCRHFSKAKGGKPVEKKIRGLAWVVLRWASMKKEEGKPRVIILENVEEFLTWGPLTQDDKPCPKNKGRTFNSFVNALKRHGYTVEWKQLRACDYGAPTIRKRLFLIARCDGQPIIWPQATHGAGLIPYKTAADCIDWSTPCPSIFSRKRPLAENTMKRIARGLKKFVFDAQKPFIVPADTVVVPYLTEHANGSTQRIFDAQEPLRTQCAQVKGGHFALCAAFLTKHFSGVTGVEVDKPAPTILSTGTQTQLTTAYIMKMRGSNTGHSANEPLHTISAGGTHHAEVRAFLLKYYGNEKDGQSISTPLGTVTSRDRFGLVTVAGVDYQVVDIGMRMLTPRELYRAQGFPDDYVIDRLPNGKKLSKTASIRMCGNSVCPTMADVLCRANVEKSVLYPTQQVEATHG